MDFEPRFCPYRSCRYHRDAPKDFFAPHGSFAPKCRTHRVPRFFCDGCRRTFSRQTFRHDYRMRKPHLVESVARHLVSGGSLRQAARTYRVARRTIDRLLARMGRHAAWYQRRALSRFEVKGAFQLDELETYEQDRIFQPLTVGTLLQEGSRFVAQMAVGTLRSRASKSEESKARRRAFEEQNGRRKNESRDVVAKLLLPFQKALEKGARSSLEDVVLTTDEKKAYPVVLKRLLGKKGPKHVRVSSLLPRDGRNPLAPINQLEVMTRHHNARLQRESIAASKRRRRLSLQLSIFQVWWNFWRRKTNESDDTPAMAAGIVTRRASWLELFGWRQDLGGDGMPLLRNARAG